LGGPLDYGKICALGGKIGLVFRDRVPCRGGIRIR